MEAIPANELKRRGISVVDPFLTKKGMVYVIKNNKPQYVIMKTENYEQLINETQDTYLDRLKQSLQDVKKKRVRQFKNANALIKEFNLED